jgi:hypothetical protein
MLLPPKALTDQIGRIYTPDVESEIGLKTNGLSPIDVRESQS